MPDSPIVRIPDLPPVDCPCGSTRRAFTDDPDQIASLHVVDVTTESRTHYHKKLTEVYYFLEGEGELEIDGVRHRVRAGDAVLIKPGRRHRAIPGAAGGMKLLNVPIPAFDPDDEWFD